MSDSVDICIVGGGMAGLSTAFWLAPHASVMVLERESQPAYHSTGRSAALYAPQYGSRVIRRLTEASGPFLKAPPAGFCDTPILSDRGFMTIGSTHQHAERAALLTLTAESQQVVHEISTAEARQRVPRLRHRELAWALFDPTAMDIDVHLLLQSFLKGAKARDALMRTNAEVVRLTHDTAGWQIHCPTFDLRARILVNAAGAWADSLAQLAGATTLGLKPYRRTAFMMDAPTGTDVRHWPMVADAAETFYFKADGSRLLGSLAEENPSPPCDAQPDDLDVATAVDRIEHVVDFTIDRVDHAWTGLRVFGADRNPVSGFDPRIPDFYWHAGLGGYGIQTSPAISAYAAAQLLRTSLPEVFLTSGLSPSELAADRFF